MSDNVHVENGNASAISSILLGIVTFTTPEGIEYWLKIAVGLGSLVTAIMAVRYYHFATLEKKKKLNERKSE